MPRAKKQAIAVAGGQVRPADLPAAYRRRAEELDAFSPWAAQAFREAADLADAALAAEAGELLTPAEVAAAGVCCAETVRRAVRSGGVDNAGTETRVQVRRGDLDKLPRRGKAGGFAAIAREASLRRAS